MPGKEDQPTGDLWRYVQSRRAAEVEAKERRRLEVARKDRERKDRELREQMMESARKASEEFRERIERPLRLLDAPPWARELLLGRFRVRELLQEVERVWLGPHPAPLWEKFGVLREGLVESVEPDSLNPDRWGYSVATSTHRPPAEEYSRGLHYIAGAGDGAHGSWSFGTVRNTGTTFTKEIRIVVARSILREDFYDGRSYDRHTADGRFVMGDSIFKTSATIPATSSRELLVKMVGDQLLKEKVRGPYYSLDYRIVIR